MRKLGRIFMFVLALFYLSLFQNCSNPMVTHSGTPPNNSNQTGGGVDGKTYVNYGQCGNGAVGVISKVVVYAGQAEAKIVRDHCMDLPTPQAVPADQLKFLISGTNTLILNDQIFDVQQSTSEQRVTVEVCASSDSSPDVQVALWENTNAPGELFGRVDERSGATTGILNVIMPTYLAPNDFQTATGQASQFELRLNDGDSAALTYAISGGTVTAAATPFCLHQPLPPPPTSAVPDGATSGPQGAPQAASLLNAYSNRPNWRVAGVDYPVGIDMGTVLKDPTVDIIAGTTVDSANHLIYVTASNVVIDGYDFSLHGGYGVDVKSGSGTVIRNSILSLVQTETSGGSLTVEQNVFDGGGAGSGRYALLYHMATGALVARYNWFKNYPQKALIVAEGPSADVEFNLFQNGNLNGADKSAIYVSGGNYSSFSFSFNTIDQPVEASTCTDEISFDGGSFSYTGAEIGSNTIIARGTSTNPSVEWVMDIGPGTLTPGTDSANIHDNYFDVGGSKYGPFMTGVKTPSIVYSDNYNLVTGAAFTTSP